MGTVVTLSMLTDQATTAVEGTNDVRNLIRAFNVMQTRIHRLIDERTETLAAVGHDTRTPLARLQLRLETHYLDSFARAEAAVDRWGIGYVVMNDHVPHDRLAEGRMPPRLTGQALKSGRNPEAHFALMMGLHAAAAEVPAAMDGL
mgnify:CR=1 FL=1